MPRYVPLPADPAGPGGGRGSTPPRLPAGAHACRRRRRAARPPACRPPPPLAPGRDGEGREGRRRRRRRCCPPPPPPRSNIPRRPRRAPAPNNAAFQALSIAPRSSMQSSPASFYSPYSLASLFSFPFLLSLSPFSLLLRLLSRSFYFFQVAGHRAVEARRAPRPPETHTHAHTRTRTHIQHTHRPGAGRPSGSPAAARLHLAHGGRRGGRPPAHAPIHMHEGGKEEEEGEWQE